MCIKRKTVELQFKKINEIKTKKKSNGMVGIYLLAFLRIY